MTRTVYEDLRVNLPTILMGDPAYPWKKNWTESFPRHTEFREYIQYYYDGVLGSKGKACFRFGQRVEEVRRENTAAGKKYRIRTSATEGLFDHVLIASGHFDVPYIPPPFADTLKKSALHAKYWDSYKEKLTNKDVILVGFGPSALDFGGYLSQKARTLHWAHSTFEAIEAAQGGSSASPGDVHWWNRIEMTPGTTDSVRLYGRDSSYQDLKVTDDLEDEGSDEGCVVVFATGYGYNHSFLEPTLRPKARADVNCSGGKNAVPTDNLVCNFLRNDSLAFVGMQNVMVPGVVLYYQALSFVHWDRSDVASTDDAVQTSEKEMDERLRNVESDFCASGVVYDSSRLHYSQQAYCHQLLRTLCRCDSESSLENESLLQEADRIRHAWAGGSSPSGEGAKVASLPAYAASALRSAREIDDVDKISPGSLFMPPFRDTFESDLLCAYEVYRCVSEMRAERRLGALDASKVSSSRDILDALVRKEYASNRFDRVSPREWHLRPKRSNDEREGAHRQSLDDAV
eukprot:g3256.t1